MVSYRVAGLLAVAVSTQLFLGCSSSSSNQQSSRSPASAPVELSAIADPGVGDTDGSALILSNFARCVSLQGQASTCSLPSGTYLVTRPIQVQRSNIIISGASDNSSILLRGSDTGEVMVFGNGVGAPLSNIQIQHLVIDGNSGIFTCPTGNCVDFYVQNVCGSANSCAGNVTGYSPTYSVTIRNSEFRNAPAHSVAFYSGVNFPANDILFSGSTIRNATVTGLLVGGGGDFDYNDCDNGRHSQWDPSNIVLEDSLFDSNHTGAMGINTTHYFKMTRTRLVNNYWNPVPLLPAGGTTFFDQCSENVDIIGNTFVGPKNNPNRATNALELWGRNILVKDNVISDFPDDGVGANSVYNLTVTGNLITNNNMFSTVNPGWREAGVTIWNRIGHRRTSGVRVNNNRIYNQNGVTRQSYGVIIHTGDNPDYTISNITISNDNQLNGNAVSPLCISPGINLQGANSISFVSDCDGKGLNDDSKPVSKKSERVDPVRTISSVSDPAAEYTWDQWNYFYGMEPGAVVTDPYVACVADRYVSMPADIYIYLINRTSECEQKPLQFARSAIAQRARVLDGYTFDQWNFFYSLVTGGSGPDFNSTSFGDRGITMSLDVYIDELSALGY